MITDKERGDIASYLVLLIQLGEEGNYSKYYSDNNYYRDAFYKVNSYIEENIAKKKKNKEGAFYKDKEFTILADSLELPSLKLLREVEVKNRTLLSIEKKNNNLIRKLTVIDDLYSDLEYMEQPYIQLGRVLNLTVYREDYVQSIKLHFLKNHIIHWGYDLDDCEDVNQYFEEFKIGLTAWTLKNLEIEDINIYGYIWYKSNLLGTLFLQQNRGYKLDIAPVFLGKYYYYGFIFMCISVISIDIIITKIRGSLSYREAYVDFVRGEMTDARNNRFLIKDKILYFFIPNLYKYKDEVAYISPSFVKWVSGILEILKRYKKKFSSLLKSYKFFFKYIKVFISLLFEYNDFGIFGVIKNIFKNVLKYFDIVDVYNIFTILFKNFLELFITESLSIFILWFCINFKDIIGILNMAHNRILPDLIRKGLTLWDALYDYLQGPWGNYRDGLVVDESKNLWKISDDPWVVEDDI